MHNQLEYVAIDDVLPLKAARRDAVANLSFGAPGYQRLNVDGFIYIYYAVLLYSARISAIYLLPFGKVWLGPFAVCNAWQRSRTENLRRVGENSGSILPVCRPKFTKFSDDVTDPSYFPRPCPIIYFTFHLEDIRH